MDVSDNSHYASLNPIPTKEKGRKRRKAATVCSFIMTGIFTSIAFIGVVYIFRADSKETSFDELVTTGGAVPKIHSSTWH